MFAYVKLPSVSFPTRLTVCELSRYPPISAFASHIIDSSISKDPDSEMKGRFKVAMKALQMQPKWKKHQVTLFETWPHLMVLGFRKIQN